jgi:CheY-like chemotaxis protein
MKSTLAIIQMRAEKKRLEVIYESLSLMPEAVEVDEKRLRQILLNLLNNAIKFTDAGRIILQLAVVGQAELGQVRLRFAVVDTGIGMKPEQVEQIFNPFEQVGDMKKRAEGTGLGLAISKQLVEAMGCELQVKSQFNEGSTFSFELLLPLANITLTQTPISHERIVGYEGRPRKILVVDDKLHNRMVFLNILQPLGFEIALAEDGQEAIDQTQNWRPDLILMDMIMPNVTGFEATQTIRSIPALKTIAIIGTSASAFEKEEERVKLVGCDAFISKPVHVENMVLLIGELLNLQWQYQRPLTEMVSSSTGSEEAELAHPPLELLRQWHTLAMEEGDLLAIEDAAESLLREQPKYAPFVEKMQSFTSSMDIDGAIQFLAEYL